MPPAGLARVDEAARLLADALDLHAVVARVGDAVEAHQAPGVGEAPSADEAQQAAAAAQLRQGSYRASPARTW